MTTDGPDGGRDEIESRRPGGRLEGGTTLEGPPAMASDAGGSRDRRGLKYPRGP